MGNEAAGGGARIGKFIEEGELRDAEGGDDLFLGGGVNDEADHAVYVLGLEAGVVDGFHGGLEDKGKLAAARVLGVLGLAYAYDGALIFD